MIVAIRRGVSRLSGYLTCELIIDLRVPVCLRQGTEYRFCWCTGEAVVAIDLPAIDEMPSNDRGSIIITGSRYLTRDITVLATHGNPEGTASFQWRVTLGSCPRLLRLEGENCHRWGVTEGPGNVNEPQTTEVGFCPKVIKSKQHAI